MIALPGYYNRFDAADGYDELLFRAGKGLQSAELNEIQSTQIDRLRKIGNALFRDGAIIEGTPPVISAGTGAITCPASKVYIQGAIRSIPERSFTISTSGIVRVGVCLVSTEITENQDESLRDPATGTRNYNEPGAGRLQVLGTWKHEGEACAGDFFAIYTIVDGELSSQEPPLDNRWLELIARYDRESHGSYAVRGLEVQALAPGIFSVNAGVGNVNGYKLDKLTSTRLEYALDPDLEAVTAEPDTYTNASTDIQLNRTPVYEITQVVVTKEKTATITRGGFSGGQDTLPDVSIVSVSAVSQGVTNYSAPADYTLNGDAISWAPGGGEPAPGSTYNVTYRYLTTATPETVNLTAGTFRVTGAVAGTMVLSSYTWKLPRYDRIVMHRDGTFARVKGIPSRYTPVPPQIPAQVLWLATVYQTWTGTPSVDNDGIRNIPYSQIERMRGLIVDLYDLVAMERLLRDISSREPSAKKGVFVDPFIDDDMRDAGIAQTAAVVFGELELAIAPTIVRQPTNNSQDWMLPYTEEVILEQTRTSGQIKINPYGSFDPPPGVLTLTPSVDNWVDITTVWASPMTRQSRTLFGRQTRPGQSDVEVLREENNLAQFARQIPVAFTLSGFNGSEVVTLTFDGVNVTP